MSRSFSRKGLPAYEASIIARVTISKLRWNFSRISSCHCSTSIPGQTMRQRFTSPRTISSLMSRPAMIVLPAPGSSASRKCKGWRGSISSYTAVI